MPKLDAPAGDQVERRHPLGHPRGVVDGRRELHDPVAEPDALGALRRGGQEDLRARASASTPRGSGARPPRRSRSPSRSASSTWSSASWSAAVLVAARPGRGDSGARRRCRSARGRDSLKLRTNLPDVLGVEPARGIAAAPSPGPGRVGAGGSVARRSRRRGRPRPRGSTGGGRRGGACGDRRGLALGEPLGAREGRAADDHQRRRPRPGGGPLPASRDPPAARGPRRRAARAGGPALLQLGGRGEHRRGLRQAAAVAGQGVRGRRADPGRGRGLGRGLRDHRAADSRAFAARTCASSRPSRASWPWRSGAPSSSRACRDWPTRTRSPGSQTGAPSRSA